MRKLILNKAFSANGTLNLNRLNEEEKLELTRATCFLPTNAPIRIRALYVLSGITCLRVCDVCGGTIVDDKRYMKMFCSVTCCKVFVNRNEIVKKRMAATKANHTPERKKQILNKNKATCKKLYGAESYFQTKEFKAVAKETNKGKYGVEFAIQNEELKAKRDATMLERYGTINPCQNKEVMEKRKRNNIDKYGVSSPMMLPTMVEKRSQSNLLKYGVTNPMMLPAVRQKAVKTNLTRYGCESTVGNAEVRKKAEATCVERYGSPNATQNKEIAKKVGKTRAQNFYGTKDLLLLNDKCFLEAEYYTKTAVEISREFGLADNVVGYKWLKLHGIPTALKQQSAGERQLTAFIEDLLPGGVVSRDYSVLGKRELDIYIPDHNIAVEFDGCYWHRTSRIGKTYHVEKTNSCAEAGVKLFHIYDLEWDDSRLQPIWKSVIANSLGVTEQRLMARKCTVVSIDTTAANVFYNDNHLQGGFRHKSVNLGLMYCGELVSCMSFCRNRFGTNHDWELARFCTKLNTKVVGGGSRLLSHFRRSNQGSIISYANKRWSDGKTYLTLGFEKVRETEPNYGYFKSGSKKVESRHKFQKHKLEGLLETFNPELTELENMSNNGYEQLHDCGNIVFQLQ